MPCSVKVMILARLSVGCGSRVNQPLRSNVRNTCEVIMMSSLALGAFVTGPNKYFWWVGAVVLFIIMVSQLLSMLAKVEDEKRKEVMRTLIWLTIICWVGYIVLWLLGSEGTASLGLSQEVGLTTIIDLVSKAGVLFFLVANMDASDESKGTGLTLA